MDFSSPRAKTVFVSCFILAFESTSFERKTIKYIVSGFYKADECNVKRVHKKSKNVKRVRSFDIVKLFLFLFCGFQNISL